VRIIVLVLAVLALFYFDALESHGNRNQLSFDGTVRHGNHACRADVHCEIFIGSNRGQVNA
jgi:hypothetical protein